MYHTRLLESLAMLRRDCTLCDVYVQTMKEGVETDETSGKAYGVWAHRSILAAASPYFLALFKKFANNTKLTVTIKNVQPAALDAVIEYIYSPETLTITAENAQALLSAASLMDIDDLRDAACAFLESTLTADNVIGIRALAEQHSCTELLAAVTNFINNHPQLVLSSDELLALSVHDLTTLLNSLTISTEEYVLNSVMRWTQHLPQDRFRHLDDLLQHVPLPESLLESIDTDPAYSNQTNNHSQDVPCSALNLSHQSRDSALLVVGGWTMTGSTRDVLSYVPSTGSWHTAKPLPTACDSGGIAMIDNRVYLVGGENNGQRLNNVVMYDMATDAWMAGRSMLTNRSRLGVAALDGVLYAAGGWDATGKILNSVETLDPREGIWRSIVPMSNVRRGFGFVALEGMLYAAGGHHKTVERYHPSAGKWEPVDLMIERRWNVGAAVLDNAMYIVGSHNGITVGSIERYRPRSGWETVPSIYTPLTGAAIAAHAGRLHVVGGRINRNERLKRIAVLDPATDTWSQLPATMPSGRSFASVVVVDWPIPTP